MQVSNAMLHVISTALKSYYYECSRVLKEWDDEPGCFTDSYYFRHFNDWRVLSGEMSSFLYYVDHCLFGYGCSLDLLFDSEVDNCEEDV